MKCNAPGEPVEKQRNRLLGTQKGIHFNAEIVVKGSGKESPLQVGLQ